MGRAEETAEERVCTTPTILGMTDKLGGSVVRAGREREVRVLLMSVMLMLVGLRRGGVVIYTLPLLSLCGGIVYQVQSLPIKHPDLTSLLLVSSHSSRNLKT